jgi:hypothetical protein
VAEPFKKFDEVQWGPELERILAVQLRPIPQAHGPEAEALARYFTKRLANVPCPYPLKSSEQTLFVTQALALKEALERKRLVGAISVGGGKMLTCYLLMVVLGAKRPLYLLPKSMEAETRREVLKYSADWGHGLLPASRVSYLSYQKLSTPSSATKLDAEGKVTKLGLLDRLRPDLIVADEAHNLANPGSIGWKRLKGYLESSGARFIPLTGSLFRKSIKEASHLLGAALGGDSPLPSSESFEELMAWAGALDETVSGSRTEFGALRELIEDAAARRSFDSLGDLEEQHAKMAEVVGVRVLRTPGVIGSHGDPLGIPLTVDAHFVPEPEEDPVIEQEMRLLIEGDGADRQKWSLPDGSLVVDGMALARHRHTLALGFWSRQEPAPSPEYLAARLAWATAARDRLKHNRLRIDSEANLKAAIREGHFKDLTEVLGQWDDAQAAYTARTGLREPPSVAQWISAEVVEQVKSWLSRVGTGIVWCGYIPLGQRLSRDLGLPYFGAGKVDATGRAIMDMKRGEPCVVSIAACGTGTNLQHFHSRGLWLGSPSEQPLGRTHRPGQPEDRVENWVYLPGRIQLERYWTQRNAATRFASPISCTTAKLVLADSDIPRVDVHCAGTTSYRWMSHKKVLDY